MNSNVIKTQKLFFSVSLIVSLAFLFSDCKRGEEKKEFFIAGFVYSGDSLLSNVTIEVGDKIVETDVKGYFKVPVKDTTYYVVNASKQGYGLVSKILTTRTDSLKINMAKATVTTIDINSVEGDTIRIEDVRPSMETPLSHDISATAMPWSDIPFVYNAEGELVGFEMPATIQSTLDAAQNFAPPVLGAQVFIPKNGIILNDRENSKVDFSIQTIDLYSRDGMPGDYVVRLNEQERGFMKSFGAATINLNQNGKALAFNKKYQAKVVIPVDTLSILSKAVLPDSIPFLVYNEKSGEWAQEGFAKLNKKRTAYERLTNHFSTFNMDMVFTPDMASCYQICNALPDVPSTLSVEISVPGKMKQGLSMDAGCPTSGRCASATAHGLIRLEKNSPVVMRVFRNTTTLVCTKVFLTDGEVPDASTICPYDNCKGPVTIEENVSQKYLKPPVATSPGMCKPMVAVPLRVGPGAVAGTHKIKVAWLFDDDFANLTVSPNFTIQISNDGIAWTNGSSVTGTNARVHFGEFDVAIANSATKYFRVALNGCADDCSNIVKVMINAMGNDVDASGTGPHAEPVNDCSI